MVPNQRAHCNFLRVNHFIAREFAYSCVLQVRLHLKRVDSISKWCTHFRVLVTYFETISYICFKIAYLDFASRRRIMLVSIMKQKKAEHNAFPSVLSVTRASYHKSKELNANTHRNISLVRGKDRLQRGKHPPWGSNPRPLA